MSCTLSQLSVASQDTLKPSLQISWLRNNTSREAHGLRIQNLKSQVEERLEALLEDGGYAPPNLLAAMRHALLSGGKRFRPLLFILTVPQGDDRKAALDIGCALEMVHTASLILDDLPCMDDADLRRDKPATHKVFGQATAILAAISLLTRGMNILAALEGVPGDRRARLVAVLSQAVGHTGLAAGQEVDLTEAPGISMNVEEKNWLKTGRFFSAMAEMASILSDRGEEETVGLSDLAFHIGSAFQALDDLLDATAAPEDLGKNVGKDIGKSTMINDRGEAATRRTYLSHLNSANEALARCGIEEEPICLMLQSIHQMAFRNDVPV
ncbi:polyprenyl synthetase family protein [Pseudorhizobium halotolerans]|uniref:Polyprenyl synthetase family protein n=1 Tax=Pseudorhizobium halotolerans TaxID=1233081 RepID=A0ABN7JVC8_9HYPH|nr:polyprenyl synthetase family protein [Pseudorhizobium halotolerans]